MLGALAEATSDLDQAIAHYDDGRDVHERAGEIPVRAHRSEWLVDALLKRNGPGDVDRA